MHHKILSQLNPAEDSSAVQDGPGSGVQLETMSLLVSLLFDFIID